MGINGQCPHSSWLYRLGFFLDISQPPFGRLLRLPRPLVPARKAVIDLGVQPKYGDFTHQDVAKQLGECSDLFTSLGIFTNEVESTF
jgi:hypothetical protein